MVDPRISQLRNAAAAFRKHQFNVPVPVEPLDDIGLLGQELRALGVWLDKQFEQVRALSDVTAQINAGLILDEVLNHVYDSFQRIIPYDRIGVSLLEDDNRIVRTRWARSQAPVLKISKGYQAVLLGSSLESVIESGRPRVINDLVDYLEKHPSSESTALIVAEGMRSSLTCPLIATGKPIGFMFFSSMQANSYKDLHVELFLQIAGQLALTLEKGRLYQQLIELNELRNKFLGIAAHDLRHPLGVIQKYAEILLDGILGEMPGAQREILQRMARVSDNALRLVNDILDVSAIESGQLKLKLQPVELTAFLQNLCEAQRILVQAKKIELVSQIPEHLPTLNIDPDRISQVLSNFISNAVKFSLPHTVITVRAEKTPKDVQIMVEDQGPGIPQEELPLIFKDFGRTSVQPTGGEKSSGLGLAIAKRMAEAHAGRLEVRSQVGAGSAFSLFLPLER